MSDEKKEGMEEVAAGSGISEEDGLTLRTRAKELADTVETAYFALGGVLSEIARSACYSEWGFDTFDDYVIAELSFARRKAYYLMFISEQAAEIGAEVSDLRGIGWSKAKEILKVAKTLAEFKIWATKAKGMSLAKLINECKEVLGKPVAGEDEEGNKTFVGDDGETVFHVVTYKLSDAQYDNIKLALQKAGEISGSDKEGHNLDMVGLDFLAHNASISGMPEKVAEWVNKGFIEISEDEETSEEPSTEAPE